MTHVTGKQARGYLKRIRREAGFAREEVQEAQARLGGGIP